MGGVGPDRTNPLIQVKIIIHWSFGDELCFDFSTNLFFKQPAPWNNPVSWMFIFRVFLKAPEQKHCKYTDICYASEAKNHGIHDVFCFW